MTELRRYQQQDAAALYNLFYDTVHSVNEKDYTSAQLQAWASGRVDMQEWNQSFLNHYTLVAQQNGQIVGFGDISPLGYLDRLYVHKNHQEQGIATLLTNALEQYAKQGGVEVITTHASITAQPFFKKRGYALVQQQTVQRQGQILTNFVLQKKLL